MVSRKTEIESVAKVLIINIQNKALVLTLGKHLQQPEKSYLPDLPGGVVDTGESEQEAVIREVKEECSIALIPTGIRLAYSETTYYTQENKSVTKLFYVAYVDETPTVTLSWEHSDYKWVEIDKLHTIDLRPFFNKAVQYSIENNLIGNYQPKNRP